MVFFDSNCSEDETKSSNIEQSIQSKVSNFPADNSLFSFGDNGRDNVSIFLWFSCKSRVTGWQTSVVCVDIQVWANIQHEFESKPQLLFRVAVTFYFYSMNKCLKMSVKIRIVPLFVPFFICCCCGGFSAIADGRSPIPLVIIFVPWSYILHSWIPITMCTNLFCSTVYQNESKLLRAVCFESKSVANLKASIDFVHSLPIPDEEFTATSLEPAYFCLIDKGSVCATSHFGIYVQSKRQVSISGWWKSIRSFNCANIVSSKILSRLKLFV